MKTHLTRLQGTLATWGWLVLLVLGPLFLLPAPATAPVLLVVPALLWVQFRTGRNSDRTPDKSLDTSGHERPASSLQPSTSTPLDWPILGLMVMVLVSLWATYSLSVSLVKIAGMVYGVGLYYTLLAPGRRSGRALGGLVALYLAAGAALGAIGVLGSFQTDKLPLLTALRERLPAFLVRLPGAEVGIQPNEVGGFLLWISPVALALTTAAWWHFPNLRQRFGLWPALAGNVGLTLMALGVTGGLVLSQSRIGIASLAVALVALPLATGRRARNLTLVVLAVGFVVGGVVFREQIKALYDYAVYATATTSWPGRVFAAFDQRVEIWSRGIYAIGDFAVTGMGMNTFRTLVHLLYPLSLTEPTVDFGHAHNMWLQAALDLGLPGLVAYVALWLNTLVMVVQTLRAARHPALHALAVGLLGALAGSLAFGLPDAVALGARPGFLWWWLLALATLAWIQRESPSVSPPELQFAPTPARPRSMGAANPVAPPEPAMLAPLD